MQELTARLTQQQERQAVATDGYDARTYRETLDELPGIAAAIDQHAEGFPPAPELVADLFQSLYQRSPNLVPADTLDRSYLVNREIVEELSGTEAHADLRAVGTVGDPLAAAAAAAHTARHAIAALTPEEREQIDALHDAERASRDLASLADTLAELAAERGSKKLARRAKSKQKEAQLAAMQADTLADQLAGGEATRRDTLRRAAREGAIAANGELAALADAEAMLGHRGDTLGGGGWGVGSAPGANKRDKGGLRGRIALARALQDSPDLAKLAAIAGRLRRVAIAVRETRVAHTPAEVASIVVGNDLPRLLPSQLALLADPALEDQFYARYAESALLQYELTGTERAGRGPIILAEDESGSMSANLGDATRHQWAKAVGLTLAAIARKEKRDFAWVHFAAKGQIQTVRHPWKAAKPADLLFSATHNFGGGTHYDEWMSTAYNLVTLADYDKADVILLTDGLATPTPGTLDNFRRRREERGMRCYAVMLGPEAGHGNALLHQLADAVFPLSDLTGEGAALASIFAV